MLRLSFILILFFILAGYPGRSFAQNVVALPAEENLSQYVYSYGAVVKASEQEIILEEYDYDSDAEKQVTYQVDPAVKLEGIKAVTELAADDVIEIYSFDAGGVKTAKVIRKEAIEEETMLDQT